MKLSFDLAAYSSLLSFVLATTSYVIVAVVAYLVGRFVERERIKARIYRLAMEELEKSEGKK